MKVELIDLEPDIRFTRLCPNKDFELSFAIKRQAMEATIARKWPWDDNYQREIHQLRLCEKPFYFIHRNTSIIGTLSFAPYDTYVRFGEFYLYPALHGQGIGTRILTHCLNLADKAFLPVRLEYLKWNPVGSLYKRYGFRFTGESDIHWFMERTVGASSG